jgi:hypothetical protein
MDAGQITFHLRHAYSGVGNSMIELKNVKARYCGIPLWQVLGLCGIGGPAAEPPIERPGYHWRELKWEEIRMGPQPEFKNKVFPSSLASLAIALR